MILKIQADAVQEGDFLPGLDDGYVFEEPETDTSVSLNVSNDRFGHHIPAGTTVILYHDAQGEECYLIIPDESMLTVERR